MNLYREGQVIRADIDTTCRFRPETLELVETVYYLRIQWAIDRCNVAAHKADLCGELRLLAEAVYAGTCPIGIFTDRLEECPAECEASPELVAGAVERLRLEHPYGVDLRAK